MSNPYAAYLVFGYVYNSNGVAIPNAKLEVISSVATFTSAVDVATSAGTLISQGSWGSKVPIGSSRDDELILKPNTIYLRTFTSSAATNLLSLKAQWYEHTCKDA